MREGATDSLRLLGGSIRGIESRWKAWVPVSAELDGGVLLYEPGSGAPKTTKGMLKEFVRIASGEDVLQFARRFGVLGLCEHGVPEPHRLDLDIVRFRDPARIREAGKPAGKLDSVPHDDRLCTSNVRCWCDSCDLSWYKDAPCPSCGSGDVTALGVERVDEWLGVVEKARATLNVASRILREEPPDRDELVKIIVAGSVPESPTAHAARYILESHLNEWLHMGGVYIGLTWVGAEPRSQVSSTTFGLIALQLLGAIVGVQQPAVCDCCGRVHTPDRKPYANRPHTYCGDCRESGAAARVRQQMRRRRQREKAGS